MTTPSQSIQSGNTSHAANNGSHGQRGSESAPAGLENLFARIAADIEAPETNTALPATEAEPTIDPTIDPTIAVDTLPPVSDETDTAEVLPVIVTGNATEGRIEPEIVLPDDTPAVTTDGSETQNRGVQHAISVLEGIQQTRTPGGDTQAASGRPDPLVNALRALHQAGKPGGLPEQAAEPAQLNHARLNTAPDAETPLPVQALNRNPVATEQLQLAIQKTSEGLVIKPELQAPEIAAANHQNHVVSQAGAANQTLLRADGSTTIVKIDIPGSIQQPAWQQALAERVVFAAGQNIKQAEIHLHPAELGPISVRLEAAQDRAAVQFTAMHADTREALDAAMPRLRELFNQQGMELVRADVQQNNGNDQESQDWQSGLFTESEAENHASETIEPVTGPANRPANPDGIVDIYA